MGIIDAVDGRTDPSERIAELIWAVKSQETDRVGEMEMELPHIMRFERTVQRTEMGIEFPPCRRTLHIVPTGSTPHQSGDIGGVDDRIEYRLGDRIVGQFERLHLHVRGFDPVLDVELFFPFIPVDKEKRDDPENDQVQHDSDGDIGGNSAYFFSHSGPFGETVVLGANQRGIF